MLQLNYPFGARPLIIDAIGLFVVRTIPRSSSKDHRVF